MAKGSLFSHVSWTASSSIVTSFLKIVVLAYLARLLGPEEFGPYTAVVIAFAIASILFEFGLIETLVYTGRGFDRGVLISIQYFLLFFLIGKFLILPAIARTNIGAVLHDYQWPFFAALFCRTLSSPHMASTLQTGRFALLAKVEVASYLLGFAVLAVVLASLGFGEKALIWAFLGQEICLATFLLATSGVGFPKPFFLGVPLDVLRLSVGNVWGKLANNIANQADQLVVAEQLGAAAVGLYGRAHQLSVMPANILGASLNKVLYPSFSNGRSCPANSARLLSFSLSIALLLGLCGAMALAVMAEYVVLIVLGSDWRAAIPLMELLSAFIVFRLSNKVLDAYCRGLGVVYMRALLQTAYLLLMIVLCSIGSVYHGMTGVIYGALAATVFNHLSLATLCVRLSGGWAVYLHSVRDVVLLSAVPVLVFALLMGSGYRGLLPLATVSLSVLASCVLLVGRVGNPELKSFISRRLRYVRLGPES